MFRQIKGFQFVFSAEFLLTRTSAAHYLFLVETPSLRSRETFGDQRPAAASRLLELASAQYRRNRDDDLAYEIISLISRLCVIIVSSRAENSNFISWASRFV